MGHKRYTRQERLPDFGKQAQKKLGESSVLVIGVGGLGIPVLQYLNAMGVGILGMAEQDLVEETNLHRQVLFGEADLGKSKIKLAADILRKQNTSTQIVTHDSFLVSHNALKIIKNYDLVVDASDNFATRYLVNDACVILSKPFLYGALHGFEGQVSVFNFKDGPTYRCLFPAMPSGSEIPNCEEYGVLGVLPGIVGTIMALEAVKVLTGVGESLSGQLLIYNGLNSQFTKIQIYAKPENKRIRQLADHYGYQSCDPSVEISADTLKSLLEGSDPIQLIDVRSVDEFKDYHLEPAILIPLEDIPSRAIELDVSLPIYLVCQTGKRSFQALQWLQANTQNSGIYHLAGGIDAYKSTV